MSPIRIPAHAIHCGGAGRKWLPKPYRLLHPAGARYALPAETQRMRILMPLPLPAEIRRHFSHAPILQRT